MVVWDASGIMPAAPTGIRLHAGRGSLGYLVGLDQAGRLHAWGDPTHAAFTAVPTGLYSALAAATGHVSAIAVACTMPTTRGSLALFIHGQAR